MTISVSLAFTSVGPTTANAPINGILTLTNNGSNTISVRSIRLYEMPLIVTPLNQGGACFGAMISQPEFLTPNVAPGDDFPSVTTGSTVYYPFAVVVPSPNLPGPSPNAPNTLRYNQMATPPGNTNLQLGCDVRTYDSTATEWVCGSATLSCPIKSAVAPFPVPQGGAEQFNSAGDAVNWFFF